MCQALTAPIRSSVFGLRGARSPSRGAGCASEGVGWRCHSISRRRLQTPEPSERPITLAGGEALLGFLHSYLNDDPEIALAIEAIGQAAAARKARLAP